jgi:hypothetical protein
VAMRLSCQLAPWVANVLDRASIRPGLSGPVTVRARDTGMAVAPLSWMSTPSFSVR